MLRGGSQVDGRREGLDRGRGKGGLRWSGGERGSRGMRGVWLGLDSRPPKGAGPPAVVCAIPR